MNRTCPMQRWLAKSGTDKAKRTKKPVESAERANLGEMLGEPKAVYWQVTTTRCRPPLRKIVVACNWGHYFLACRQWSKRENKQSVSEKTNTINLPLEWINVETGSPINQPIHWCDIPDPIQSMKTALSLFK